MSDQQTPPESRADWPMNFKEFGKQVVLGEIRVMIRRLQENGNFSLPSAVKFEDLDLQDLEWLKRQLRDTLRTLGGGR